MNVLTQIKNQQKISKQEILNGVPESASWHRRFDHSAYVYAGGLPFDFTEGDVLAIFSQYGEIMDVHNVKDRETGKYRGFSFVAYEDQRSTTLATDNLNGATVGGRTVRVEHVDNYRKKKAEMEGREESPDVEPPPEDDPAARREAAAAAAAAAGGAAVVDLSATEQRAASAAAVGEHDAAAPAAGGSEPWGAGSIHALMAEAEAVERKRRSALPGPPLRQQQPLAEGGADARTARREKKAKKDKKHKKADRHRDEALEQSEEEDTLPSSTGLLPSEPASERPEGPHRAGRSGTGVPGSRDGHGGRKGYTSRDQAARHRPREEELPHRPRTRSVSPMRRPAAPRSHDRRHDYHQQERSRARNGDRERHY